RRICMGHIEEGTLLWKPNESWKENAHIYQYMNWLKTHKNMHFSDYQSLWKWSVTNLEDFWESLWEYFDIQSNEPYQTVLTSHKIKCQAHACFLKRPSIIQNIFSKTVIRKIRLSSMHLRAVKTLKSRGVNSINTRHPSKKHSKTSVYVKGTVSLLM